MMDEEERGASLSDMQRDGRSYDALNLTRPRSSCPTPNAGDPSLRDPGNKSGTAADAAASFPTTESTGP